MKNNEIRTLADLTQAYMSRVLPFNNSRAVLMVFIASAAFTAVELADAAIRTALVRIRGKEQGHLMAGNSC